MWNFHGLFLYQISMHIAPVADPSGVQMFNMAANHVFWIFY